MMCPQTGAIHSSLRTSANMSGKEALGISSVTIFPRKFSSSTNGNARLALAFGKNSSKVNDTYAMLLSIRSGSSPAILHWKCRLPESDLTAGLIVSPCGHYIIGGGASGTCFVWSTLGGKLLTSFKSHYRSCTCLSFSDSGRYVLTGGADGMVHLYSLLDLVDGTDAGSSSKRQNITPFHTWSAHHFPITSLKSLRSGRVASSSEDGLVVVVEIFSQGVVATLQLPHGILCLDYLDGRLYAGSTKGDIYSIDLNAYAFNKATNQGAMMTKRRRLQMQQQGNVTSEQMVFGEVEHSSSETNHSYQSQLEGHDKPVTSLTAFVDDCQERLVSGDAAGVIRIWDLESRTCLRVVQPWSHSALNSASVVSSKAKPDSNRQQSNTSSESTMQQNQMQQQHPVTSIQVIPQAEDTSSSSGMFGSSHSSSNKVETILTLMTPLQRYASEGSDGRDGISIPFLRPLGDAETIRDWHVDASYDEVYSRQPFHCIPTYASTKADVGSKHSADSANSGLNQVVEDQKNEILRLQKELEQQKSQVQRWEAVNNKLMAKLNAAKSTTK